MFKVLCFLFFNIFYDWRASTTLSVCMSHKQGISLDRSSILYRSYRYLFCFQQGKQVTTILKSLTIYDCFYFFAKLYVILSLWHDAFQNNAKKSNHHSRKSLYPNVCVSTLETMHIKDILIKNSWFLPYASVLEYEYYTYWHKIWQRGKNIPGCWHITTLFKSSILRKILLMQELQLSLSSI